MFVLVKSGLDEATTEEEHEIIMSETERVIGELTRTEEDLRIQLGLEQPVGPMETSFLTVPMAQFIAKFSAYQIEKSSHSNRKPSDPEPLLESKPQTTELQAASTSYGSEK